MRRGVVRRRRKASRPVHDGPHAVADRETRALEGQYLVVLAADRVAARDLLEQPHAAGERLREPFLLRREDPSDLLTMLAKLRIGVAHLLDDHVRELGEVRRREADAAAVLDGPPDDPAQD